MDSNYPLKKTGRHLDDVLSSSSINSGFAQYSIARIEKSAPVRSFMKNEHIQALIDEVKAEHEAPEREFKNYYFDFDQNPSHIDPVMPSKSLKKWLKLKNHAEWQEFEGIVSEADKYWKILTGRTNVQKLGRRQEKEIRMMDELDEHTTSNLLQSSTVSGSFVGEDSDSDSETKRNSLSEGSGDLSSRESAETLTLDQIGVNTNATYMLRSDCLLTPDSFEDLSIDDKQTFLYLNENNSSVMNNGENWDDKIASDDWKSLGVPHENDESDDFDLSFGRIKHVDKVLELFHKSIDSVTPMLNLCQEESEDAFVNQKEITMERMQVLFTMSNPKRYPAFKLSSKVNKLSCYMVPAFKLNYLCYKHPIIVRPNPRNKQIMMVVYEETPSIGEGTTIRNMFMSTTESLARTVSFDDTRAVTVRSLEQAPALTNFPRGHYICYWDISNTLEPMDVYCSISMPTCVDYHPSFAEIIVAGFEDGDVMILSFGNRKLKKIATIPLDEEDELNNCPVCQVKFVKIDEFNDDHLLLVCRTDGSITEWLYDNKFQGWMQRGGVGRTINDMMLRTSYLARMRIPKHSRKKQKSRWEGIYCNFTLHHGPSVDDLMLMDADGSIIAHNANKMETDIKTWEANNAPVLKLDFNPFNDQLFLSLSAAGEIYIWSTEQKRPLHFIDYTSVLVFDVQWSVEYGYLLMILMPDGIDFWDLQAEQELVLPTYEMTCMDSTQPFIFGSFTFDRRDVILATGDGQVFVYRLEHKFSDKESQNDGVLESVVLHMKKR